MSSQNLISGALTPETKDEVLKLISDIKAKLNFLLTLQPDEIKSLVKAANGFAPFIDKSYNSVTAHPEIMSNVFDIEEYKRDYQLVKDLTIIANQVGELHDSLQNSLMAVNSDALVGSLEVYSAIKQNRDKVPGLNVIAQELAEFFQKARKKTPANTTQAAG